MFFVSKSDEKCFTWYLRTYSLDYMFFYFNIYFTYLILKNIVSDFMKLVLNMWSLSVVYYILAALVRQAWCTFDFILVSKTWLSVPPLR